MDEGKKLYQKACDDVSCGFLVKSRNKNEIIAMIKMHAKNIHNIDAKDEEVMAKIMEA